MEWAQWLYTPSTPSSNGTYLVCGYRGDAEKPEVFPCIFDPDAGWYWEEENMSGPPLAWTAMPKVPADLKDGAPDCPCCGHTPALKALTQTDWQCPKCSTIWDQSKRLPPSKVAELNRRLDAMRKALEKEGCKTSRALSWLRWEENQDTANNQAKLILEGMDIPAYDPARRVEMNVHIAEKVHGPARQEPK